LKYSAAGQLVFFFQVCTNKIPLPNPNLRLYNSPALTFPLVPQEEARKSSVSDRMTRSRARNEASSSQQAQPQPFPAVPQAFHKESFPTGQVPGLTPMYDPGWEHTSQTHKAGESGWEEGDATAWAMHSSDSEGLPPPV
jgi:hypothetical protein